MDVDPDKDRDMVHPFDELRATGLLWWINRVCLHPRGFALGLHYGDDYEEGDEPIGWSVLGDGTEPWQYAAETTENEAFRQVETFLDGLRQPFGPPKPIDDPDLPDAMQGANPPPWWGDGTNPEPTEIEG